MIRRLVRAVRRVPRVKEDLHHVLSHPDRKSRRQIAGELWAFRRAGMSSRFYLERVLYQRAAGNPADYLTEAETYALWDLKRRPDGYLRVFNDKTLFDEHLRREDGRTGGREDGRTGGREDGRTGIPLPAYLGQTRASVLLRPGHANIQSQDRDAFARALRDMVERSPTGRVFAKPADDNKGTGAMLIQTAPSEDMVDQARKGVLRVDYVFQEAVDQHPELNRLHPGCLNTLRILTGTSKDGSFPIIGAILRVGQGEKPVDNAHAGGLVVSVNRETGRLGPRAHAFLAFGGATYERHPDTGVAFGGFEVPFFAEAVDLARRAHAELPLLYVGWDIGITPDGPVLIEGNSGAYLAMMEVPAGGFKADPVARAFLIEHGIMSEASRE